MTSNEEGPPSAPPPSQQEDLSSFFRVLAASFAQAKAGQEGRSAGAASRHTPVREDGARPARGILPRPMLLAASFLALAAWAAPLFLTARAVVVPDTLIGSWKTSAPLYRDRGFTITSTSLVLRAGPNESNVSVHAITRVRTTHSGADVAYTIDYLVEQSADEFSFRLSPGSPAVIRAVHQPEVAWRKEGK